MPWNLRKSIFRSYAYDEVAAAPGGSFCLPRQKFPAFVPLPEGMQPRRSEARGRRVGRPRTAFVGAGPRPAAAIRRPVTIRRFIAADEMSFSVERVATAANARIRATYSLGL